jgi:hypothetical protein
MNGWHSKTLTGPMMMLCHHPIIWDLTPPESTMGAAALKTLPATKSSRAIASRQA